MPTESVNVQRGMLDIQKTKLNIILFLNNNDDNEDATLLNSIDFSCLAYASFFDIKEQLLYMFNYIEDCVADVPFTKYQTVLSKFLNDTDFLTIIFNNEITVQDFLVLTNIYNVGQPNNADVLHSFVYPYYNFLKPFKNITLTKENLKIILNYISKVLVRMQLVSYSQMLENKDYLNEIYADAEYFINKKSDFNID